LNRIDVGRAAQAACALEAISAKPGNVNRLFDFADTTLADFLLSAVMIGRCMERADRNPVGKTILRAVQATKRAVPSNTNLGIVLLFAPLAKAYAGGDLRTAVRGVLDSLTVTDAISVSRAIRLAAPGGLGKVSAQDVACDPDVTLLELMSMAREKDAVASEYASGYTITFELACPSLHHHLKQHNDFSLAIVQAYLTVLAEIPDTLIARKKSPKDAQEVSCMAAKVLRAGGMASDGGREEIRKFDAFLRSGGNSLNPGTTADLIAAAVFTYFLQQGLDAWQRFRA
jgi:triphosphoribosyl-dephospho-CoA synthase